MRKFSKALRISICLCLALVVALMPIMASAEEASNVPAAVQYAYASDDTDDIFYKISHPESATSTTDGIVDYTGNGTVVASDEGQGDRGQNYAWSSIGYGDWVYVGTCYSSMGSTLQLMGSVLGDKYDKETMTATLNAIYNGTFFNGE